MMSCIALSKMGSASDCISRDQKEQDEHITHWGAVRRKHLEKRTDLVLTDISFWLAVRSNILHRLISLVLSKLCPTNAQMPSGSGAKAVFSHSHSRAGSSTHLQWTERALRSHHTRNSLHKSAVPQSELLGNTQFCDYMFCSLAP